MFEYIEGLYEYNYGSYGVTSVPVRYTSVPAFLTINSKDFLELWNEFMDSEVVCLMNFFDNFASDENLIIGYGKTFQAAAMMLNERIGKAIGENKDYDRLFNLINNSVVNIDSLWDQLDDVHAMEYPKENIEEFSKNLYKHLENYDVNKT